MGAAHIEVNVAFTVILKVFLMGIVLYGFIPRYTTIGEREVVIRTLHHAHVRKYLLVITPSRFVRLARAESHQPLEYRLRIIRSLHEVQQWPLNNGHPRILKPFLLIDGPVRDDASEEVIVQFAGTLFVTLHRRGVIDFPDKLLRPWHSIHKLVFLTMVHTVEIHERTLGALPLELRIPFIVLPGSRTLTFLVQAGKIARMGLVDGPGIITHLDIQAALLVRFRVGIVTGDIVTIPYGHIILGRCLGV